MTQEPETLARIERSLGRIEGALEGLSEKVQHHVEKDDASFSAAFKRIDSLEQTRDLQRGFAKVSILIAVLGSIATLVAKLKGIF